MLSAIVNAGGNSTRMGEHKALLPMPNTGIPLVAHTAALAAGVVDGRVIVVANHPPVIAEARRLPGVTVVGDDVADRGPLAGLAAGLALVSGWALALACDMPLLQPAVLHLLARLTCRASSDSGANCDIVMPVVDGRAQTMCAAYHRRCLPYVATMLSEENLRIRELFTRVRVRYVEEAELRTADPTLQSFANVNTPQDWEEIRRAIQPQGS